MGAIFPVTFDIERGINSLNVQLAGSSWSLRGPEGSVIQSGTENLDGISVSEEGDFARLGDTLTIFNYKNNVYDGEFKKYFCGDVEIGDKMNGKLSTFDRTKSIKKYIYALDEYGTYVNGKLNGQFKTGLYHREAHAEGVFDDGNKIGEWRYFDENDKLVLFEKYNELGELIEQKPQLQPLKGE